MSKEVGYIWRGFFFLLVVLAGMGIVQILASIDEPLAVSERKLIDGPIGNSSVKYSGNTGKGYQLFQDNCASCHNVVKDMTGPALRGIEERVKDKQLLHNWIRNSPAVLKSGNKYFNDLYNAYNKMPMNLFPQLSDAEINDILYFIRMYNVGKPY